MDVMLNRVAAMPVRRVFAHLFFLFLVCPILNPAFGGETRYSATTVYLYCLFPLLDWKFLRLQLTHVNGPVVAGLLSLLAAVAAADMAVALRMMALGLCFAYLGFLYREGELPLLGAYTLASAAVAVVQFALAMLGSPLQEYLYPDRIAGMLWGDAAILARPSFDDGVLFPVRVAGLSREPSFFNLQVLATLFIHAFVTRIFFTAWALDLGRGHRVPVILEDHADRCDRRRSRHPRPQASWIASRCMPPSCSGWSPARLRPPCCTINWVGPVPWRRASWARPFSIGRSVIICSLN